MNLGRAFGAMALITILSRLSGFIRVAVFAAYYGSGAAADIFLSIMMIPEIMYRFGADGLISSAAVPIFVDLRADPTGTRQTFRAFFWGICFLAFPAVLLTIFFAPALCELMVPGFIPAQKAQMVDLLRLIAPYILFSLLGSLAVAFLNARGSFGAPSVGPILVNGAIIAGILVSGGANITLVTAAVTVGAILQFVWLLALAGRQGGDWRFPDTSPFRHSGFRDFLSRTAPISIWILLTPIVPLFERYLLSSQPQGSVAILNYCDKLLYFPLGILSISLTSAIFPLLSRQSEEETRNILHASLWTITALLWPLVFLFFFGAPAIIGVVFKRGLFTQSDVILTGNLLQIYSLALLPLTAAMLLNRFFFCRNNFRLPLLAGLVQITLQIAADQYLVKRWGPVGLGWGAVSASTVQVLFLLGAIIRSVHRERPFRLLFPFATAGALLLPGLLYPFSLQSLVMTESKALIVLTLGAVWAVLQALMLVFTRTSLQALFRLKYQSSAPNSQDD